MSAQQPSPRPALSSRPMPLGIRIGVWLLGLALLLIAGVAAFIHSGLYDIGADSPHSDAVFWLLQTTRNRSIEVHATDEVPSNLTDPKRIASGAAQYDEMCASCHSAQGMERTEISRGLYPRAPELRRPSQMTSAERFWVIKHGIKMTGMPAWGMTHDDEILWDIVAFLNKLPELSADQYRSLVKSAPKAHSEIMQNKDGHQNTEHNH